MNAGRSSPASAGTRDPKSIAVLGGGITGLTAAFRLSAQGHRVRLFEQGPRLGGVIRTERTDGWLIESGPNSFQPNTREAAALLAELGLSESTIQASPAARNRYIVRRGKLEALPSTPGKLWGSSLFSTKAKLRILTEFALLPRRRGADVSVAAFLRSHFGPEVLEYAGQPFASGIYAGDINKLSARNAFPALWKIERSHGSLLRGQLAAHRSRLKTGAKDNMISFRQGLQTLTGALGDRLPPGSVLLDARVETLFPGPRWQVLWHQGQHVRTEMFDGVISTLPAPALARLTISPLGDRPLASLDQMAHPPLASLFLGFRRDQVAHPLDGFGVLVPAAEKRALLGAIFSSTIFPDRAPADHVAITLMIGGALQPELATRSAEELWAAVRGDLHDLLGIKGEPVFRRHTFWPRAIAQYHLGHERHLEAIKACEQKYPGLFLGGNLKDGVSIAQCISAGERLAARVS